MIDISLEKYYEPHRRLRLIGTLNTVGLEATEKKVKSLIVKTIKNDKALCKLLHSEVFPSIQYQLDKKVLVCLSC